jgi:hypothetical protein
MFRVLGLGKKNDTSASNVNEASASKGKEEAYACIKSQGSICT